MSMADDPHAPAAALPPLTEEQAQLVALGLPMVERYAAEISRRLKGRIAPDELMAWGTLALDKAARNYRPEICPSFLHFARHHVEGDMLDAVQEELGSLRARVERAMDRAYCRAVAQQTLGVDLFADEDEALLQGARNGCAEALAAAFVAGALEAGQATPEDAVAELEGEVVTREQLKAAMGELTAEERRVVEMVYEGGMTMVEVARVVGVHVNTVQKRHGSALRKLRRRMVGERSQ
jgi:RNA polymerase sigma factor (sigma-70 family)